jgi:hypothetical protein
MLSNLKNMASDMGQEIEKQNTQIDKIGAKVSIRILLAVRELPGLVLSTFLQLISKKEFYINKKITGVEKLFF